MANPILILYFPPIFPFLPTYSSFTRGEPKIGCSLERKCPSSLPGTPNAPAHRNVCVPNIKPFFLPVDTQYTPCPSWFFIRDTSSVQWSQNYGIRDTTSQQGYRNSLLRRGRTHPFFPNSRHLPYILPQDSERSLEKVTFFFVHVDRLDNHWSQK